MTKLLNALGMKQAPPKGEACFFIGYFWLSLVIISSFVYIFLIILGDYKVLLYIYLLIILHCE